MEAVTPRKIENTESVSNKASNGFKETEVGLIPVGWGLNTIAEIVDRVRLGGNYPNTIRETSKPIIKMGNMGRGGISLKLLEYIPAITSIDENHQLKQGDVLFNTRNTLDLVGKVCVWRSELSIAYYNSNILRLEFSKKHISTPFFVNYALNSNESVKRLRKLATGTTSVAAIYTRDLLQFQLPVPPFQEQQAIAEALGDADALIEGLEKLIAKKRLIKQGAMQELLTGKRRLPGFSGSWKQSIIAEIADCLDNLRVPLNSTQRANMEGQYPYCGANGVLDYVNDYCLDDDVILMAEDGGYFDEYETRPIAYQMTGKIWVNNHAHILKAKEFFDNGFLYYSLVHKNILPFLASGTRAKLNKSEMNKIEVSHPPTRNEQIEVSNILSGLDAEIDSIQQKLTKVRQIKQGMMQELLTGRIRLI